MCTFGFIYLYSSQTLTIHTYIVIVVVGVLERIYCWVFLYQIFCIDVFYKSRTNNSLFRYLVLELME